MQTLSHFQANYLKATLISLGYLMPIWLMLWIKPIWSFEEYSPIMLIGLVFSLIIAYSQRVSLARLGFTNVNKKSWWPYLASTIVLIIIIILARTLGLFTPFRPLGFDAGFFVKYVLISAPLQELLFRSINISLLEKTHLNSWVILVLSSIIFGSIHLLVSNFIVAFLTGIIGLLWGYIFIKYRNWYALTLSHAALGMVSIVTGLI